MKRLVLIIGVVFFYFVDSAQVVISDINKSYSIKSGISFLEDRNGKMLFEDVFISNKFAPVKKEVPNFGISKSAYWLKVEVKNSTSISDYQLQVLQPGLDEIDFYYSDLKGNFNVIKGGECLPFNERNYFDPTFIYSINIDTIYGSTFFIRVKSRDNLQVPIVISSASILAKSTKNKDFVFGIYAGMMIVMLFYNLFLFISVRDKVYIYYVVYLITVILTQISIQGYTFQYLWPDNPFIAQWSAFIFSPLVGVASAYFLRDFLKTKIYCVKLDKYFVIFYVLYFIAFCFAIMGAFDISFSLITLCATLLSMYMMFVAFYVYRQKYKPALIFIISWSLFLFGVTVYALTNLGLLPINNFTFYTMTFGSAAEVILLSFALADRINVLKKEKEQSQEMTVLALQQNEKLIIEQNVMLERKVDERTVELIEANDELNITLYNLKGTQAQLVSAEKMASLGQLTAGIAHEINNPINFVSANIKPLKLDLDDVLELVKKYEAIQLSQIAENTFKEIDEFKKEIDFEYLKTEMAALIAGIEEGAQRTAEIVSGLKNFSRLDENDIKTANINEGILSTLTLLKSAIPPNTEVITELGNISVIDCFPGKLNQVFMNLFSNALYAISQKEIDAERKLIITTYMADVNVYVRIEDTGIGMTPEIKAKIFEPFFTTKNVGEGTGLGMSIVFNILESHLAKIEVESEYGVGTKILLILNKKISLP